MNDRWFRSWHGAPTDPKWPLVAEEASCSVGFVSATVWALLDYASSNSPRGYITGVDLETLGMFFGIGEDVIMRIVAALRHYNFLTGDLVTNWFRYQSKDKDVYRELVRERRSARKKRLRDTRHGRLSENDWSSLRKTVFERDNFTCQYCGAHSVRLECDHVIPVARGGTNDLDNLATSCFTCNRSKRCKLLSEWLNDVSLASFLAKRGR